MNNVNFERVHRMKEKQSGATPHSVKKNRLIVAKFTFFKERERVRKSAKMFTHYLKQLARQADKKARLVKDRLYVEGKEVLAPKTQQFKGSNWNADGYFINPFWIYKWCNCYTFLGQPWK